MVTIINNTPLDQYGGGPGVPNDAAGALYAINASGITDVGGGEYDTTIVGYPMAWFSSITQTKYAGTVTSNSVDLSDSIAGYFVSWYQLDILNSFDFPDYTTSNAVHWHVQGNAANGIAGFSYTDNTPWPVVTSLNVPATMSKNSAITITFSTAGTVDFLYCMMYCQGGIKIVHTSSTNATSVTFSASDVAHMGLTNGQQVNFQVMPCSLGSTTLGGKKYYFAKQSPFSASATVQ